MQGRKIEHPYVRWVTELVRTGLGFICVPSEKVVRYYLMAMNFRGSDRLYMSPFYLGLWGKDDLNSQVIYLSIDFFNMTCDLNVL